MSLSDITYLLALGARASGLLAEDICAYPMCHHNRLSLPIMKLLVHCASPNERTAAYIQLRRGSVEKSNLPFWEFAVALYLLRAGDYFLSSNDAGPGYSLLHLYYETLCDCRFVCALIVIFLLHCASQGYTTGNCSSSLATILF